jgi:hypothetical protein
MLNTSKLEVNFCCNRRSEIVHQLLIMTSLRISGFHDSESAMDHMEESYRLAVLIHVMMVFYGMPRKSSMYILLTTRSQQTLNLTDLRGLWNEYADGLMWMVFTASAAATDDEKIWFGSLAVQLCYVLFIHT